MDRTERELLARSVAGVIEPDAAAEANDDAIAALGWADVLADGPDATEGVVFDQLGRAAARSTVLDDLVAAELGLPIGTSIVHPAWGFPAPVERFSAATEGTMIRGSTGPVRALEPDGLAWLDRDSIAVVSDHPDTMLARVRAAAAPSDRSAREPAEISRAVRRARWALAHQLNGLAAGMVALAREHALERLQFGRPIASFQAVRHRLADAHVAVEAADAAIELSDEVVAENGPDADLAVDLARILAGRATNEAARHGQQVLAGIGFTREHRFHRYLFAVLELDGLYGTTALLTQQLGRRLVEDGEVPRVVEL